MAGGGNGEKSINMGEIWEAEIKGLSDSLEVERVSEKGIKEDSSFGARVPARKSVAFTETENTVGGQGWRSGERRRHALLRMRLVWGHPGR